MVLFKEKKEEGLYAKLAFSPIDMRASSYLFCSKHFSAQLLSQIQIVE